MPESNCMALLSLPDVKLNSRNMVNHIKLIPSDLKASIDKECDKPEHYSINIFLATLNYFRICIDDVMVCC